MNAEQVAQLKQAVALAKLRLAQDTKAKSPRAAMSAETYQILLQRLAEVEKKS